MKLNSNISLVTLLLFLLSAASTSAQVFNVKKYGANPNGASDNTNAFLNTWKQVCAFSNGKATFLIPAGSYLVGPIEFKGPCKGPINFKVQGTVKADPNPAKFKEPNWITFNHLTNVNIFGKGVFDGQGSKGWAANKCATSSTCHTLPINLRFNFLTNARVSGITSLNSKAFQMNVLGCKNITFDRVTVTAPENAPNTDGIHMGDSSQVTILNSNIGTGDDCVSIGPGSVDVKVIGVNCGPGHGISIGSLGKYANENDVTGVTVRNCTLTNTMNGIRIKSWAKAKNSVNQKSIASHFIFEDIVMNNVGNPIVIDQVYCPYVKCSQANPSLVQISDVTINNIRGTTSTKNAVNIVCSKGVPCKNVKIGNVNLKYVGKEAGPATAVCSYTNPIFTGKNYPAIKASFPAV